MAEVRESQRLYLTENFRLEGFVCPCCGKIKLSYVIPYLLQKIRDEIEKPIIVTSGYRCPMHNKKVGGVKDSLHLKGEAVDITANKDLYKVAALAYRCGFYSVIVYPDRRFVHCQLQGRLGKGIYKQERLKKKKKLVEINEYIFLRGGLDEKMQ